MRSRGVTLLEMMVVVAIIGIVAAMAASTAEKIGARNATQNATSDVVSAIMRARALAEQHGTDVYVVIFARSTKTATTGGVGSLFIYEDSNGDFLRATGACDGSVPDCGWANFTPANHRPQPNTGDKLLNEFYLVDYAARGVRFKNSATALTWKPPFAAVGTSADATGCSFCSGAAFKGAIVFSGDQQIRLLNDAGAPIAQRVGGVAFENPSDLTRVIQVALSTPTGLLTVMR